MNLINRILQRKQSNGVINAVNGGAKHVEIFSNGREVELQGHFFITERVGFLKVELKQLLESMKNNTHIILEDARINFYEGDEKVSIFFPIPKRLQETDGIDLIVVKKSNLAEVLRGPIKGSRRF